MADKFVEEIVQLGTRMLEINRAKAKLTREGKKINREIARLMKEQGVEKMKQSGISFTCKDYYMGWDESYLKTLNGYKRSKAYHEMPCNPYALVLGKAVSTRTNKAG